MPFVFGIVGIVFIVAGVRGNSTQLFSLVKSDFSGSPNYFEWMIAIFLVGAIGYIKELSTISRMFMVLVLAGLLYQNKNVFSQLATQETQQPTVTPQGTATQTPQTSTNSALPALPQLPTLAQDAAQLWG